MSEIIIEFGTKDFTESGKQKLLGAYIEHGLNVGQLTREDLYDQITLDEFTLATELTVIKLNVHRQQRKRWWR